MKQLASLLVFLSSFQLSAQTRCDCYDRLLNLAYHYATWGKFEKAIEVYRDAASFMDEKNEEDDLYRGLVYCYDTLAQYDSSVSYAIKAYKAGLGANEIAYYTPKTFARIPSDSMPPWPFPGQYVDWNLYQLAEQVKGLDQYVRNFDLFDGPWLPDSLVRLKRGIRTALFLLTDSSNYVTEMQILRQYGWPGFKDVGFANAINGHVLLHNVRHPWGRKLLDTLYHFGRNCDGIRTSRVFKYEDNRVLHGGETGMGMGKNLAGFFGVDRYNIIYDLSKADSLRLANNHLRLKEDVPPEESLPKEYKAIPYPPNYFCLKKYQLK